MTRSRPITETRVEAYIASALRLLGWLLAMILRFKLTGRSARLRDILNLAERGVESVLYLQARARWRAPPRRRRLHPRPAPQGFRRSRGDRRLFLKSANIRAPRASALKRVFALIDALARPERAIAHFYKRLCKGLTYVRLTPVAPPADTLARDVLEAAARTIDSS